MSSCSSVRPKSTQPIQHDFARVADALRASASAGSARARSRREAKCRRGGPWGEPEVLPPKKTRRAGGAFVHPANWPLRACASGSHSAGLRPTRAPYSTGAAMYAGRRRVRKGRAAEKTRSFRELRNEVQLVLGGGEPLHVLAGNDPNEAAVFFDDRQAPDAVRRHEPQRF